MLSARCSPSAAGFANVDGNPATGCEINLMTNPNHCGAVGVVAQLPHAIAACQAGTVVLVACDSGWLNLDGGTANGCETADTGGGPSAAAAVNLGTLNVGGSVFRSDVRTPGASDGG